MKVIQISIARFHHFHLARQLEKHGLLKDLYTGYPRYKLADELKIPTSKIKTFPWVQAPYMAMSKVGLDQWPWLNKEWAYQAHRTIDQYVASKINDPITLIALSGSGLSAGKKAQTVGGIHICDRGSSHIRTQNQLLLEEYQLLVITHTLVQQMQELQVELLGDQHQALIHKDHLQQMLTYLHIMHFVTL